MPLAAPPSRSALLQALGLVAWLALAYAAGAVGAVASVEAASFYAQLARPSWAPPGWLFGPVWTVLYTLMGLASWAVWRASPDARPLRVALGLYLLQLAVNALWSWLFFGWHLGAAAMADVLVLVVLIALTVAAFWRISRGAALLLLPYLLWVSFAAALTWAVWRGNPAVL